MSPLSNPSFLDLWVLAMPRMFLFFGSFQHFFSSLVRASKNTEWCYCFPGRMAVSCQRPRLSSKPCWPVAWLKACRPPWRWMRIHLSCWRCYALFTWENWMQQDNNFQERFDWDGELGITWDNNLWSGIFFMVLEGGRVRKTCCVLRILIHSSLYIYIDHLSHHQLFLLLNLPVSFPSTPERLTLS